MKPTTVLTAVEGGRKLKHNIDLHIAIASTRKTAMWKNSTVTWETLVRRLSKTHRTHETFDEYKSMPKSRRDEIKDVGGFVGGYLMDGRRKADTVRHRQLVSLDADHLDPDNSLWELVGLVFGHAAVMYSTHSHEPGEPRLRLLIPLDRPVTPEEYIAISRQIAGTLGIDQFDDTTFEPHRLMYWPSTAKDGEYLYEYLDAPIVSADEILESYIDWRDPSSWPVSSRVDEIMERQADKQGHPHEKPGFIGLFNRLYDIHEAIETFIPDRYESFSDDRYTFTGGSTAGGLVVYQDGLFAYSHHGSDPVGNELVNSFDLVRLHLYGAQDDDSKPGTPINKLPSSTAMRQYVKGLPEVKAQIQKDRLSAYEEEFADIAAPTQDEVENIEATQEEEDEFADLYELIGEPEPKEKKDSTGWIKNLTLDSDDGFDATRQNIIQILMNDEKLKGRFALDEFSQRAYVLGDLPWRRINGERELLNDFDEAGLRNYLETVYDISHLQKTQDAMAEVLHRNAYNPIKDYLAPLEWDQTPRVDTLLIEALGAEDNELNRAITRKTLVAAVARIYEPGCKMDYMLTLAGRQGLGKSSLFGRLAGDWFSDSLTTVTGKEAYEQLQGAWIVEMGELSATRKADIESVKHFLTKRVDRYRVAYGRHVSDFPRQSIFVATTNDSEFLRDQTGNRRFWVMPVGVQPIKRSWETFTDDYVNQIWAEAVHLYKQGEKLYLPSHLEEIMSEIQAGHSEQSHLEGMILEHLEREVPDGFSTWGISDRREFLAGEDSVSGDFDDLAELEDVNLVPRDRICALEIWVELLHGTPSNFTAGKRREINTILRHLDGWEQYNGNKQGRLRFGAEIGAQKAYTRL